MSTPITITLGQPRQSECGHCSKSIFLVQAGTTATTYKWVTDPKKPTKTWRCDPTRDFPVRSHEPRG